MHTTLLMESVDRKYSLAYWKDLDGEYAYSVGSVAQVLGLEDSSKVQELLGLDGKPWHLSEYDVIHLAKKLGNYDFITWFAEDMARLRQIHTESEPVKLKDIARKLDWLIGFHMGASAK